MDCSGIDDHLSPLVDGELEGEKAELVRAHLEKCPHCRRSFQNHVQLKHILSQKLILEKAPPGLKSAILERLASSGIGNSLYVLFARLRAKPFLASAAVVAVLLAVFGFVLFLMSSHRLPPLVEEVLANHAEAQEYPLEIVSDDHGKVAQEISFMLKRDVPVPDLRSKRCSLIGGRQCPVCRKTGAEIRYVHPAAYVSLFIVPLASEKEIPRLCSSGSLREKRIGGKPYLYCDTNSGHVVMWWDDDAISLVASNLDLLYLFDIASEIRSRSSR